MLLMKLKSEEKFAFLALAYYIANIDGEFYKEEKDILVYLKINWHPS